jgi:hypothetical protein
MRKKLAPLLVLTFFASMSCAFGSEMISTSIVDRLQTTHFGGFFGSSTVTFKRDNLGGVLFKIQPGYVGGGIVRSRHRGIGVAVFESQEQALAAVQNRRNNVATLIHKGPTPRDAIELWWFADEQALLSVVHKNIVVEVNDIMHPYSEVEDELWDVLHTFLSTVEQMTDNKGAERRN